MKEKLGELFETFGFYQKALDAYVESESFSKAVELAKKIKMDFKKIEEKWGDYLFKKIDYKNSIKHFIEADAKEKVIKATIKAKELEKFFDIINKFHNLNLQNYIEIGEYFEFRKKFDKAEEFYIKGGEFMKVFKIIINQKKIEKIDKILDRSNVKKYKEYFERIEQKFKLNQIQVNGEYISLKFKELKNIINNKEIDDKKDLRTIYYDIINEFIDENDINEEIILSTIEFGKSVEEIEKILKLSQNFEQLLNIIFSKFDFIMSIFLNGKKILNIDNLMDIKINYLEKIKEIHNLILNKEKEKKIYFINFKDLIMKMINFFQNKDIDNLLIIKEMILNQKKSGDELKELTIIIDEVIIKTILYFMKEKALNSKEIIDLIIKIGIKNFENKEEEIINLINIYDLKKIDFPFFCKIWENFNDDKNLIYFLVRIIFKKIKELKDFGIIYDLIPDNILDQIIAKELENKIIFLFNFSFDEKICVNVMEDLYKTLRIFILINYPVNNFLDFLEKRNNLSIKKISQLYLRVLQDKNLNKNEEINNHILEYLLDKNIVNNLDMIYSLVVYINSNNKNLIRKFFNIIEKYIINVDDFLNPNMYHKFKLYTIIHPIFYKNYNKEKYFVKSNFTLNVLYNNLTKLNLSYDEFIKLIEQFNEDAFKEKLIPFNLLKNNEEEEEIIYGLIKMNKNNFNKLTNDLFKLENLLKTFLDILEKDFLNEIKIKKENLKNENIMNTLKNLEDFLNNSNQFKYYQGFFKITESNFFMALYSNNKQKNNIVNQKDLLMETVTDFLKLKVLNNLDEELSLDNIPFKDIIIEEIRKIIQKCLKDKNNIIHNCLNKIRNELDLINELNKLLFNQSIKSKNNSNNYNIEIDLAYLPYFKYIKKVIESLIIIMNEFKVDKTSFYQDVLNKKLEIENNKNILLKSIKNNIEFLKKLKGFELDITFFDENENNSIFVEFLNVLSENNKEAIEFGMGKTNNELGALFEFAGESENSSIQIRNIIDLMEVCNFFEKIKKLNINNDIQLINEFKKAFISKSSLANSFINYLNNFKEIKNLYNEHIEKPENSKNKIEQILKYSTLDIFFDNELRSFQIKGNYKNISNQEKIFNYNELEELHDRALLLSNQTFEKFTNNALENIETRKKNSKIFLEIIDNINQLIIYLKSLYIKGYPNPLEIKLQIKESLCSAEGKEIKELLKFYKSLSNDLENSQTKAYKEKSLIRLIYGHQFFDLFNYLNKKNSKDDIIPLLKKISNSKIQEIPEEKNNRIILDNEENETKFDNMIKNINDFLFRCFKINKMKYRDIYQNNKIKDEFKNKLKPGFYSWANEEKLEIKIINVYKIITGNFPLAITVLSCTKETNEEEITSFIYRAILCEFKVLFIIINSDNLELSNAQYLLWILESLYIKNENNINSTLLITFDDINSILRKELIKLRGHYFFNSNNFINNNTEKYQINNLIEVWSSDATGVGKSTQIRLEAKRNKKNYLYFQIGGVISRRDIIDRIIKLKIDTKKEENNFLHIDIYDSNEETTLIIKEFLFSLLITRSYSYNDKIFYVDENVKIVIEIPIGFYNMKDKFTLLEYFPSKIIKLGNLPNLIDLDDCYHKNNNITDIQLISNILLMLKNEQIEENVFDLN